MSMYEEMYSEAYRLLDACRPDRYNPSDTDWMEPVIERISGLMTEGEARRQSAEMIAKQLERRETTLPLRVLRQIGRDGAPPLDWFDLARKPLSIAKKERVVLGAMSAADWAEWASWQRRHAMHSMTVVNEACDGAEAVRDQMLVTGAETTADLWDMDLPWNSNGGGVDFDDDED